MKIAKHKSHKPKDSTPTSQIGLISHL